METNEKTSNYCRVTGVVVTIYIHVSGLFPGMRRRLWTANLYTNESGWMHVIVDVRHTHRGEGKIRGYDTRLDPGIP